MEGCYDFIFFVLLQLQLFSDIIILSVVNIIL